MESVAQRTVRVNPSWAPDAVSVQVQSSPAFMVVYRFLFEVARDITERKRAGRGTAKKLKGSWRKRLAHMGSWAWSPATLQLLYWSEAFEFSA